MRGIYDSYFLLSKAATSNISFDFGEEDDINNPQAWQGPLVINQHGDTSCMVSSEMLKNVDSTTVDLASK